MSSHDRAAREREKHHLLDDPPSSLDAEEREKAKEEEKLNAATTHEVIRREGVKELERSPERLFSSGIAAGLSIGLSFLAQGALQHGLPEASWKPLAVALGYPIGFLALTLGSQQLFTENTLRPVVPVLAMRRADLYRRMLMLWGVVLVANLLGTLAFAFAAAHTPVFPPELAPAFRELATKATGHDFLTVFARAIPAGMIIATLVWMLPAATATTGVVVIMTWLLGAAHLSHVIVGAVDAFYLVAIGDLGFGRALGGYVLPALAGNTIGGVLLVAALAHAQVEKS